MENDNLWAKQPPITSSSLPIAGGTEPPKKPRKKLTLILGIVIGALALLDLSLIIVHTINGLSGGILGFGRPNHIGTRTMMIYMVGSNLESDPVQGGFASEDIAEIIDAEVTDDVKVVIYAGGAKRWQNGWRNGTIYELDGTSFKQVASLGVENTGDPKTLQSFIDYTFDNYKSNLYDLVFWDHGAGPILGFGSDELYEDKVFDTPALLSIEEISTGLENSNLITSGKKFELIGFDACLMASAEIATHLSSYADWLVASQELEPGFGWDYSFLSEIDRSINSETFGTKIIDTYSDFYEKLTSMYKNADFSITLSLVDLTKMAKLTEKMDDLFSGVQIALDSGNYSQIVSQMTRAQFFGDTSFDLIDLYGVTEQLELGYASEATALGDAVKNAVVYQRTNIEGANGLSIYYPYYTKSVLAQLLPIYNNLNFSQEYSQFLSRYSNILTGSRLTNWQLRSSTPTIRDGEISVTLGEEVAKDYNRASYVIFAEVEDDRWSPVFKSSDVTMSAGGVLSANFNRKQFVATEESLEGKYTWASLFEHRRETDFTTYRLPAMLFNAEEFAFRNIYVEYRVDNQTLKGEITSYVPMASIDDFGNSRETIDLSKWDTLSILNFSYKIFDENGDFTGNLEGGGDVFGSEYRIGEEELEIDLRDLDADRTYYCLFQIYDTQDNLYSTNIIKL